MPNSGKPFKKGQLVVNIWSKGKTAKSRVCKVINVTKNDTNSNWSYYTYQLMLPNGQEEFDVYAEAYISFEEYRTKIQRRIQASNKTIAIQEKEYHDSFQLEKDAKKLFPDVGV